MNILEIIAKKRDGKKLSKEEIDYFIKGYTSGDVTDYQAAALVMAIYINGDLYKWRFIKHCKDTKNIDINKTVLKKSLFLE